MTKDDPGYCLEHQTSVFGGGCLGQVKKLKVI